jgi:hypothetical protein
MHPVFPYRADECPPRPAIGLASFRKDAETLTNRSMVVATVRFCHLGQGKDAAAIAKSNSLGCAWFVRDNSLFVRAWVFE